MFSADQVARTGVDGRLTGPAGKADRKGTREWDLSSHERTVTSAEFRTGVIA
jgi:hypothetical protein